MALDKRAVREGTLWNFRDREVEVLEVTARRIIFLDSNALHDEVVPIDDFLRDACEPGAAEHRRLVKGLRFANHDLPSDSPTGRLLVLLRDAALYQLERTMPGLPVYVAPESLPVKAAPGVEECADRCVPRDASTECSTMAWIDEKPAPSKKARF